MDQPRNSTQLNQGDEFKTLGRYSAWEVILMALTAWLEGQDQGEQGMLAICWVIRNRVMKPGKTWWGDDWEEVVLKKWQFSALAEAKRLDSVLPGDPAKVHSWDVALRAAESTYLGMGIDPTGGATHYYAPKLIAEPAWVKAPGTIFKCQIVDHLFYKAN